MVRCMRPAFARLCSMVATRGDQRNTECSGSTLMNMPWSFGAVTLKIWTKHPQLHWVLQKLDIKDITSVLRWRHLSWHGHVQRATSCIKSITNFPLPSTRKKGRPWKTRSECVKTDVNMCGLAGVDPPDRDVWRAGVWHSLVLPTP